MDNGHSAYLLVGDVALEVVEVTPPGIDGGAAINTTTHNNQQVMTKAPGALIEIGDSTISVVYSPTLYAAMMPLVNVNKLIEQGWPIAGKAVKYWGYVQKLQPTSLKDKDRPLMNVTIVVTNRNNSRAETLPNWDATGTTTTTTTSLA